jgi:hypothetical protein
MERKIETDINKIFLDGNLLVTFDYEIKEFIAFENVIVICLNYYYAPFNENVFGINYIGEVLWQISKYTSVEDRKSSFVGLNRENENSCWAVNWDGTSLLLDITTGKVLNDKWVR